MRSGKAVLRRTRLVAFVMIVIISVYALQERMHITPMMAMAEETSSATGDAQEIAELRETNSETYLRPDGQYECVVYSDDKYYADSNGDLQLIDNTIERAEHTVEGENYAFANAANNRRYFFAENEVRACVSAKNRTVSFTYETENPVAGIPGGHALYEEIAGFQLQRTDAFAYNDVSEGTDIVYVATNGGLKEYIVVRNSNAPTLLSFRMNIDGMQLVSQNDGTIKITDDSGDDVFLLDRLFAVDANGVFCDNITYSVREENGISFVDVCMDEDFLTAVDRVFPVLIDPSVMITGDTSTKDSYVSSRYPTTNYYLNTYLRTGRDDDFYSRRSFLKFDLPGSLNGSTISEAYIQIHYYSGAVPNVKAYRVTGSWTSSSITWNNMPGYTMEYASTTASAISNGWYRLNVSTIVSKWALGTYSNYGFLLRDNSEVGTTQWTTFHSSDAPSPNKPELHIVYVSNTPITVNRAASLYGDCNNYKIELQYQMNCYGYAVQMYSTYGTSSNPYRQKPGEFANDLQNYSGLTAELLTALTGSSVTNAFACIYGKIQADFATLNSTYGTEWTIEETTATASVPNGKRKIALAIGLSPKCDFHFYFRHSNGKWSHKPGAGAISDVSKDTQVEITDSNITTVALEGGYDDGVRFYLIGKSATIDYPHGMSSDSSYMTPTSFTDRGGIRLEAGATISGSILGCFDYPLDVDCFVYTASTAGYYTIKAIPPSGSTTTVGLTLYDTCGNVIATDTSSGTTEVHASLSSGTRYFIQLSNISGNTTSYVLQITY